MYFASHDRPHCKFTDTQTHARENSQLIRVVSSPCYFLPLTDICSFSPLLFAQTPLFFSFAVNNMIRNSTNEAIGIAAEFYQHERVCVSLEMCFPRSVCECVCVCVSLCCAFVFASVCDTRGDREVGQRCRGDPSVLRCCSISVLPAAAAAGAAAALRTFCSAPRNTHVVNYLPPQPPTPKLRSFI